MTVRTLDQRMEALEVANRLRLARVARVRELEAGESLAAPLVMDPPEELEGMFVFDFLRSVPRVGLGTIRRMNRLAMKEHVNLVTTLGKLSPRERHWLATRLGERQYRARALARRKRDRVLRARPQG